MNKTGIEDIILKSKGSNFFNNYLNKEDVAQKILDGFMQKYQKGKGFAIDDMNPNGIGIISNVMALSTLLEIFDLSSKSLEKYHSVFSELLSLIFDSIWSNDKAIFDASPYLFNGSETSHNIDSYVETISKVLIVMTDMRDFILNCIVFRKDLKPKKTISFMVRYRGSIIKDHEILLKTIESTIILCIKRLNRAALPIAQPFDYYIGETKVQREGISPRCEFRGWAFIDHNGQNTELYDTSIYYTYHATNALLALYTSLDKVFNGRDENKTDFDEYAEFKYREDDRFYNSNKSDIDEFRKKSISAARYLDKTISERNIDITNDFIGKGLNKINYQDVLNFQNSNAVIETLFAVAIFINGALDEDYESLNQSDDFYDKIQFTIVNIKKIYSALKKIKKEDLISSYKMIFNTRIPAEYDELIQKFRKNCLSIRVYDLVPLITNTYYVVLEFLIKYPTRDMITYLEMVMENRSDDDSGWYWDKDGFNINNNLYYIFAIENFYDYYYKYENPLSKIGLKYNKDAAEARLLAQKSKEELNHIKEEKAQLQLDYDSKKSQLDKAVEGVFQGILSTQMYSYIDNYIADMIDQNIYLCIEKEKAEQNGLVLSNAELYEKFPKAQLARKLSYTLYTGRIVKSVSDAFIDSETIHTEVSKKMIKQFEDHEKVIDNKGE